MPSKFAILWMLAVLAIFPAAARAESLPEGWPCRRQLTFKAIPSDNAGDNAAWAEFYTNGTHKPDGSDLRVTDANRGVLPMRVLQVSGESDLVRIAFATHGDGPYSVWWGNPKAEKPAATLDLKRGLLAEVYKFPGGPINNEQSLRKSFEHAGPPVGALFLYEIFLGHNPLGEEWTAMIRYKGDFKTDRGGSYEIAFEVADSGDLMIDGKMVAQRYNSGFAGHVRNSKTIDLAAGWHTIEATQVNANGGPTGIVVAWRRAGDKNFAPIPGNIFAPIARATDSPLETIGKPYTADFSITPEAEAFCPPESYIQRYSFEARLPASYKPTLTWDFGDGQAAALAKIHHYFLTPGNYAVTMKLQQGAATFTGTRRIIIKDRMYARFPQPPEDPPKTVQAVLKDYNLAALSAEGAFRGAMLFKKHGLNDEYVPWGKAWLSAKDVTPERTYRDEVFDLSRMCILRKEPKDAAEVYRLASERAISIDARTLAMRSYVMTLCDYTDDVDKALTVAQEWLKKIPVGNRGVQHTTLGAITYAALAKGDGKLAAKTAQEAGVRREQPYDKQQLQQGVLVRNIETYNRTKDFDTATKLMDQWELEFPEAMVEGFTRLMRVKVLAAEGRPDIAARIAVQHAQAMPNGFYAAELLYRAADNFKAAGDAGRAKAALDLLKSKYPESPYANDKGKMD